MSTIAEPVPLPTAGAVMDRAGSENFPVASRLLPRREREHLLAIYGYARLVDTIGDEAPGDRSLLLDRVDSDLDRIYARDTPEHEVMRRLAPAVAACGLPRGPLDALVAANRQDQRVQEYATFEELLAYCELSANPVGTLVLHVFGAATPERLALSDRVCTALQLAEHWQDVAEDLASGRVYLPGVDRDRFGVTRADLAVRPAPERVRALIAFEVARARGILREGTPLVRMLRGRPRLAVAAFAGGGRAALDAIEAAGCDVSAGAPRATRAARAWAALRVLARPGAPAR